MVFIIWDTRRSYHQCGIGAAVNYQKSLDAFKEAAAMGKSETQFEVGKCSLDESLGRKRGGEEEKSDTVNIVDDILDSSVEDMQVTARKWFDAAAQQGHAQAYEQLAVMHTQGLGGEKNLKAAIGALESSREISASDKQRGQCIMEVTDRLTAASDLKYDIVGDHCHLMTSE
jgi:hypothetical protein